MSVDPKDFWENKIIGWEKGRYEDTQWSASFLERLANRSSNSLRFRLAITMELLSTFVRDKTIVEIGCGSGLLAGKLLDFGAKSYVGYDIAEIAIYNARALATSQGYADRARFEVSSVSSLPPVEGDIVFSLGLLDWLTNEELDALFKASGKTDYFHAIAEKRGSITQLLHRLYVHIAYGHKTGSYVPRYFTIEQMQGMIRPYNDSAIHVFRDPRLSFGAILSSLLIPETMT